MTRPRAEPSAPDEVPLPHPLDLAPPASPGLYIHIPFCVRQCLYCAFYVEPLGSGPIAKRLPQIAESRRPDFLRAIEAELQALPKQFAPHTVYLGGGTPTELSDPDLAELLKLLHRYVDLSGVKEWSCEANPGTLRPTTLHRLRDAGVNRLSLGIQSFDPETLEFLTRIHSPHDAREAYDMVRQAGFDTVSIDLIFGIPGRTATSWQADLDQLVALQPDHTTCYLLEFEAGTGLDRLRTRGFVSEPEDEEVVEQYARLRDTLGNQGYQRYELFAFAQPGHACLHHRNYWAAGEYLGLGPSAHSHWQGERWQNPPHLGRWQAAVTATPPRLPEKERLSPTAKARETLIVGLRRAQGVSQEGFAAQTGYTPKALRGKEIDTLIADRLLEEQDGWLRLTDEGLLLSDHVFRELI